MDRALQHGAHGNAIDEEQEWATVAYFYSAYHLVCAALLTDPIFSDLTALKDRNSDWIPDDRYNRHHQQRKNSKTQGPGVRDMVDGLYPKSVRNSYFILHDSSINIRYHLGHLDVPATDLEKELDDIFDYFSSPGSRCKDLTEALTVKAQLKGIIKDS